MNTRTLGAIAGCLALASAVIGCGVATQPTSTPSPTAAPTPAAAMCVGREMALGWDRVAEIVRRLGDAWMAPDAATRLAVLDEIWADNGLYVNQYDSAPAIGRQAVASYMEFSMADNYLEITAWDPSDMHNDRARIQWRVCCPDGRVLLTGTEFAEIDSDGRFARVTSFWDRYVAESPDEACA